MLYYRMDTDYFLVCRIQEQSEQHQIKTNTNSKSSHRKSTQANMILIVLVVAFLYLLSGASASEEQTIITEIKVIEDLNLVCLELTMRGIPIKEDFFRTGYRLNLKYYDSRRDLRKAVTMEMNSANGTCNAMVRYNVSTNAHITHVCEGLKSPFIAYYGLSGQLNMKNMNSRYDLFLKRGFSHISAWKTEIIHRKQHTSYPDTCQSLECRSCSRSCTALYHDLNEAICNERVVQLHQDQEIIEPLSVIDFSTSNVSCIHFKTTLMGSCVLHPKALIENVWYRGDDFCMVTLDDAGTGYWCLDVDAQKLKDTPMIKVTVTANCKSGSQVKTTRYMDLRSLEFSIENRVLHNRSSKVHCSNIIDNSKERMMYTNKSTIFEPAKIFK